jgi:predicted enzyme related to lactoylglutathione lyase
VIVERMKVVLWAADTGRAVRFWCGPFGGTVVRENPAITEIAIAGGLIAIHSGGEGKRTWTGLGLQVPDVVAAAEEVVAAGGSLTHEPQPENGEPPHLAMCTDTEGNEFMLSRKRGGSGG